jgi:hypothetical protein
MLFAEWEEAQPSPVDIARAVPLPGGGIELRPLLLPARKVARRGRIVGYVTNAHGQVCAICKDGDRLLDVPLVDLIVVEDTKDASR